MNESEVYANPARIQSLAEEIKDFVGQLRSELEQMESGLQRLGGTWQDGEYQKFRRSFERVKADLGEIDQEIAMRERELEEDATLLLAYLQKSQ